MFYCGYDSSKTTLIDTNDSPGPSTSVSINLFNFFSSVILVCS